MAEKGLEPGAGLEGAELKLKTLDGGDCAATPKLKPVLEAGAAAGAGAWPNWNTPLGAAPEAADDPKVKGLLGATGVALSPPNENVGTGVVTGAAVFPPKVKLGAVEPGGGLAPKLKRPLELAALVTGVAPNEDEATVVVAGAWNPPNGLLLVTEAAPKPNDGFTSEEFPKPPKPCDGAVVVTAATPNPPKVAVDAGADTVVVVVARKLKEGVALDCPNWKAGFDSLELGA